MPSRCVQHVVTRVGAAATAKVAVMVLVFECAYARQETNARLAANSCQLVSARWARLACALAGPDEEEPSTILCGAPVGCVTLFLCDARGGLHFRSRIRTPFREQYIAVDAEIAANYEADGDALVGAVPLVALLRELCWLAGSILATALVTNNRRLASLATEHRLCLVHARALVACDATVLPA